MADDSVDWFYTLPRSLTAREHHDFQQAYLQTLAALMYYVNRKPANKYFSRCYPSVQTIQSVFGQGRRTVLKALAWLKANDYVYYERRGSRSSLYTVILQRQRFRQVRVSGGCAAAISDYEAWIEVQRVRCRAEKAGETRERQQQEGKSRPSSARAAKYPTLHFRHPQDPSSIAEVHSGTPMGVREATRVLQATQNKIDEIRGTRITGKQDSGATPPEASLTRPENLPGKTAGGEMAASETREAIKEFLARVRKKPDAPVEE